MLLARGKWLTGDEWIHAHAHPTRSTTTADYHHHRGPGVGRFRAAHGG